MSAEALRETDTSKGTEFSEHGICSQESISGPEWQDRSGSGGRVDSEGVKGTTEMSLGKWIAHSPPT